MSRLTKFDEEARYYETARGRFTLSHQHVLPDFTIEIAVLRLDDENKPRKIGVLTDTAGRPLAKLAEIADRVDEQFHEAINQAHFEELLSRGWVCDVEQFVKQDVPPE
jgi:hypothetical protein